MAKKLKSAAQDLVGSTAGPFVSIEEHRRKIAEAA